LFLHFSFTLIGLTGPVFNLEIEIVPFCADHIALFARPVTLRHYETEHRMPQSFYIHQPVAVGIIKSDILVS
jgi:hypothetical protein